MSFPDCFKLTICSGWGGGGRFASVRPDVVFGIGSGSWDVRRQSFSEALTSPSGFVPFLPHR